MLKLLLLLIFIFPLASQEVTNVSQLQGEVRNNLIRLSWQNRSAFQSPVYIYRTPFPVQDELIHPDFLLFEGVRPTEIPFGITFYVDEVEYHGTYYYFIAVSDAEGRHYNELIPNVNFIEVNVSSGLNPPQFTPAVSGQAASVITITPQFLGPVPGAQSGQSGISALQIIPQSDRVIISFLRGNTRSAALYRSIRPIMHTPDLLRAVIVQTGINSPFVDFPVPGIPYYYAVINEDDLVRGTVAIIPGVNSSINPVEVSTGRDDMEITAPVQAIRLIPLPQLRPSTENSTVRDQSTSRESRLNPPLASLLQAIPERPLVDPTTRSPEIFAIDMDIRPSAGEDFALNIILTGSFMDRDWHNARDELSRFLALPRGLSAAARARFYLGQCFYFLNMPREALFEFLAIQDTFPDESREWVQASLELMRN